MGVLRKLAPRKGQRSHVFFCHSDLCPSLRCCVFRRLSGCQKKDHTCCVPALRVDGMGGFEPPNTGVKAPCLTAWQHPHIKGEPDTSSSPRRDPQIYAAIRGGTGGIRTHGAFSHHNSFQDCAIMTTLVLCHIKSTTPKGGALVMFRHYASFVTPSNTMLENVTGTSFSPLKNSTGYA